MLGGEGAAVAGRQDLRSRSRRLHRAPAQARRRTRCAAAPEGLDVLVFGQRRDAALTALPRAGRGLVVPPLGGARRRATRRSPARPPPVRPSVPPPRPSARATSSPLPTCPRSSTGAPGAWARPPVPSATGLNHVVLAARRTGRPGALPLAGGGAVRGARRRRRPGAVGAWRGEPRGASAARPAMSSRAPPGPASRTRSAPASGGTHLPRLRHPRAERHVLLPAVRARLAARPWHRPALARDRAPARTSDATVGG